MPDLEDSSPTIIRALGYRKRKFHNHPFCELSSGDDRPRAFLETKAVENRR